MEFAAMRNSRCLRSIMVFVVSAVALSATSEAGFGQLNAVPQAASVQDANGGLVICGGGRMPDSVFKCFRDLAGNQPQLVVIPTASIRADDSNYAKATIELWATRGFKNVVIIHTRDRKIADSDEFVKPLNSASAVWIGGGSQSKIAAAYLGTQTEEALYRVQKRGGVIGGTSAGAAVMSKIMIASGSPNPIIKTGFDLLKDAIVDQHFVKRKRQSRLESAVKSHPRLTGYGIDEGTALVVKQRVKRVIGKSTVTTIQFNGTSFVVRSHTPGTTIIETEITDSK